MPIVSFECLSCRSKLTADEGLCGNITICRDCGQSITIPIPGLHEGLKIADYNLKEKLGSGGMGEVWLAYHPAMDRHVALKILSPKFTSNGSFVARFLNEAKNSAKLHHPNIVTAYHAGVENGIYYLAVSYVQGKNLRDRIDAGEIIPEKEALQIVLSITDALEYAWNEFKIVHRDIKPANIIIDKKGNVKLLDLGISKSLDDDNSLTIAGAFVGTPFYMSPEQALADKNLDFLADIYSLGATLYHMTTGVVPFDADTAMAIISRHLKEPLPSARDRNPALSEKCAALIDVMMAKKKEERPQSWLDARTDIKLVLNGEFPKTSLPKRLDFDKTIAAPPPEDPDNAQATGAPHNQKEQHPSGKPEKDKAIQKTGEKNNLKNTGGTVMKTPENKSGRNLFLIFGLTLFVLFGMILLAILIFSGAYLLKKENRSSSKISTIRPPDVPSADDKGRITPEIKKDETETVPSTSDNSAIKKLNSVNCAKILAERNIVETVYGVKLRFSEEVNNILEGSFQGTVETKTGKRTIKGIKFEPVKYDAAKDIAQSTAILKLSNIADIVDKENFNIDKFPDKVIKRTAFATSTPSVAQKIAAIRAAEIDAYKNLYKRICGFTLESQSRVENFILKSDKVKASVLGALMGAEFVGFTWEGEGDNAVAVVKLRINIKELSEMLPEKIIDSTGDFFAEAEGKAAQKKESSPVPITDADLKLKSKPEGVVEGNINLTP